MDEYIGERRVRMEGVVVEVVPERRLVWKLRKLIKLPVRLALGLTEDESGVAITHTIEAGFTGPARLLDPLIRLHVSSIGPRAVTSRTRSRAAHRVRLAGMLCSGQTTGGSSAAATSQPG